MKASSDAEWINVARSGLRILKPANPTPVSIDDRGSVKVARIDLERASLNSARALGTWTIQNCQFVRSGVFI